MGMVELLQPIGDPDLLLVSVDRKLRGLPPGEMEWVCQHSCVPEDIPGCAEQPAPALDEPMLELLEAITGQLALSVPILPPASGREETSCVRPAQFIRRLL